MDVPSKCTIVRAIGMTAYRLETKGVGSRDRDNAQCNAQNTPKKGLYAMSVKL